ncbi:YCF48-related protein [Dyella soli]|uniref:Glycosyl hydrolase n=1 Tax=Dyella soli TaxID=522319 RepID=A0A4R0YMS4_9GAMM|nr:YCF48-related protein [Dyella soli]TCI10199.1 glycosyl hydrolase [Dyella soli]
MFLLRVRRALVALALMAPAVASAGFADVLDTPASQSPLASRGLLNGLALAGKRVVAVGQRGQVVYSDDAGANWRQASVPVASDLVAVNFPTPQQGWAVGHDGVVLHSSDGGATWVRQLDGRHVGQLMMEQLRARAARGELGGSEDAARVLDEAGRIAAQGAENPFLDVWFADEHNGFIVGAFNLIFRTTDGGNSWVSWFDRTENPDSLHLYAVRGIGTDVYIAGEQGLLLKLDRATDRFKALGTPYKGTYFGIVGTSDAVIVYGLRGNAYRSADGGAHWQAVDTGIQEGLTGSTAFGAQELALVSQAGSLLLSRDSGAHFQLYRQPRPVPTSAVAVAGDAIVTAGALGVKTQPSHRDGQEATQ